MRVLGRPAAICLSCQLSVAFVKNADIGESVAGLRKDEGWPENT